jgi:hypothetical protein
MFDKLFTLKRIAFLSFVLITILSFWQLFFTEPTLFAKHNIDNPNMDFLKNLFGSKKQINNYNDFWTWFQENEATFYKVVKNKGNFDRDFLDKVSPKLNQLREGYWLLTGMADENTAELVFTADGNVKNFVFIEELVNSAPKINNWKFTAHKPPMEEGFEIGMNGYKFSTKNVSFYENKKTEFPDEISLSIVYTDKISENDRDSIGNAIYIFLDNFLGELEFATRIDEIKIVDKDKATSKLVPIDKIKEYLIWREKEFIEKYEGTRRNTENDAYSSLTAQLESGNNLIAVVNTNLLKWDRKASHPWILSVEIEYKGQNGLPDKETYELLDQIEDNISTELKDFDGYLNIGRQSANNVREIYFACKEYRKSSKTLDQIAQKYKKRIVIKYDIYKDKYWHSFDRFNP